MKNPRWIVTALATGLLAASLPALAAEPTPENWDGLVQIKAKKLDVVFLLPGADFRKYTKVMLDPTEVAFHKDWMKNMNDRTSVSRRVSADEAAKIQAEAKELFEESFHTAFTKAGYQVVTAPADDVLRVSTGVANLYLNAPDQAMSSSGRSRTYTANAGEATLVIEVRDGPSNALMGRVVDRRETREGAGMTWSTSVTNRADFRALFDVWAKTTINGIEGLKGLGQVPTDLKAGQKLN